MLEDIKIKTLEFIKSLSDLRTLGQFFFVILILLISWSGVKAIQTNYDLQKQIAQLEQEVSIKKLENENLKLNNQYLETSQFLDLAARRQFGKAAPGEKLIIVPNNVAKSFADVPKLQKNEQHNTEVKKPFYQENLEAWISFFFRKSQNKLLEST